ncbi:MAG: Ig-like domain-containing protein [Planctomycetota bacterium]
MARSSRPKKRSPRWFSKPFGRRVAERAIEWKRGRKLSVEGLEDRRVLAVFIGPNDDLEGVNGFLPQDGGGQFLGSDQTVVVDNFDINDDTDPRDVFLYRPGATGTLFYRLQADIPGVEIIVTDLSGDLLSAPGAVATGTLPVVEGQAYYFIVSDENDDDAGGLYGVEIINTPAPAPSFIDLVSSSDTGASNTDNVTGDTTPTFLIQADLAGFLSAGIDLLDASEIDGNGDGDTSDAGDLSADGAGVYVSLVNLGTGAQVEGFANQVGGTGTLWSFTSPGLTSGDWFVSAAVQVVDGRPAGERQTDRAQLGNPLTITVTGDAIATPAAPDLLTSSDTGMLSGDNVTNTRALILSGTGPENLAVDIFARSIVGGFASGAAQLVGEGVIGTDGSADPAGDAIGLWQVMIEPLVDGQYQLYAVYEDDAGNRSANGESLTVTIDTVSPGTPGLDLLNDTGRSNADNITTATRPSVLMTGNALPDNVANSQPNDLKYRLFLRPDGDLSLPERLVYDSFTDLGGFVPVTQLPRTITLDLNSAIGAELPEGVHEFRLQVEDRAGNVSEDYLLTFEIDTTPPPVSFGDPNVANDGLTGSSDTGVTTDPATLSDRITSDSVPTLWGYAEANSVVRVFADVNDNGTPDAGDVLLGITVAVPLDGNQAFAVGYWELTTALNLNQVGFPTLDGERPLLVTAEDLAGNVNGTMDGIGDDQQSLDIFVDTQGPRIESVTVTDSPSYDLFDTKPSTFSPTPLVNSLEIAFSDLPVRAGAAPAVAPITAAPGLAGGGALAATTTFDRIETPDDPTTELLGALLRPGSGINVVAGSERFVGRVGDGVNPNLAQSATFSDLLLTPTDASLPTIALPGTGVFLTSGIANIPDSNTATAFDFGDVGVTAPNEGVPSDVADLEAVLLAAGENVDVNNVNLFEFEFTVAPGQTSVSADFVFGSDEFPDQSVTDIFAFFVDGENFARFPDGSLVSFVTGVNAANFNANNNSEYAIEYDGVSNRLTVTGLLDPTIPAGGVHTLKIAIANTEDTIFDSGVFVADVRAGTQTTGGIGPGTPVMDPNAIGAPPAINEMIALTPGLYQLGGDHVGNIAIESIEFVDNTTPGMAADTRVRLIFAEPLPDDRYTLTVRDGLLDDAGNQLDGESNAVQPLNNPTFPSGDGVPGGDFVARFTVDSRPEIGTFVAQSISIDTNGNFFWDPAAPLGGDATNTDLSFTLPLSDVNGAIAPGGYNLNDLVFAGQFGLNVDQFGALTLSGFDTLAAFGFSAELNQWRWLIDRTHDGVVSQSIAADIFSTQPLLDAQGFDIRGAIPVAGEFDGNPFNGDEIGLYNAGQWFLDTNRSFVIGDGDVLITNDLHGHPIIGDFDGDGLDDAAVFNNNQLFFNFAADGSLSDPADDVVVWGYPGVLDRPVAADMDQDGIDDIGLFVPRNSSATPRPTAEWYFKLSGNPPLVNRPANYGTANYLDHPFTPEPFGADLYAEFGDELSLPIVGNFDPPVESPGAAPAPTPVDTSAPPMTAAAIAAMVMPGDYNANGAVDELDLLVWKEAFGTRNLAADGNGDGVVNVADFTVWRDNVGATAGAFAASSASVFVAPAEVEADESAPLALFAFPFSVETEEATTFVEAETVPLPGSAFDDALLLLAGGGGQAEAAPLLLADDDDAEEESEEAESDEAFAGVWGEAF